MDDDFFLLEHIVNLMSECQILFHSNLILNES
jgi:hypothetical protein